MAAGGTRASEGVRELMAALFDGSAALWEAAMARDTPAYRPSAVAAAGKLLVLPHGPQRGASSPPIPPLVTAGAVLQFLDRGHAAAVPALALRLAEVALERELLPEVAAGWGDARARAHQVRAELRTVRAALAVRALRRTASSSA